MLDKIVTTYRKAKMSVISGLSGAVEGVLDETSFYDIGYMQSQIKRIQKEMARVSKELEINIELKENSDYARTKRQELTEQREYLLLHLIYFASNSFGNLDDCVKMAEGYNISFMSCVEGLQAYQEDNKEKAYEILKKYYQEYGSVEEHFLINKVFGLLLMDRQDYKKAVSFLTYALQFMPDDMESINTLRNCYEKLNNDGRVAVMDDLLSVLA
jgi:tetratricopeptide (TPR) repeat protein